MAQTATPQQDYTYTALPDQQPVAPAAQKSKGVFAWLAKLIQQPKDFYWFASQRLKGKK